ncbi:MAG: Fic/DOC family protein [Candidatus Magasanikbacteria bacterium]
MVNTSRYNLSKDSAGIDDDGVLKNKMNIKDEERLANIETLALEKTYDHFIDLSKNQEIETNLSLLFSIHKYFLGDLYDWAGEIREVNISKGDTLFVPPLYIKQELGKLKSKFDQYIPKSDDTDEEVAEKLAYLHCELNVIHPFRDGNGRAIRLFINLLALNVGYDLIDFNDINREEYLQASKDCMKKEYSNMKDIIFEELEN